MNLNKKYDDIINLEHHVSKKHPQMSLENRSAQFAPFATLTGYGDVIKETARLTCNRKEIDEELKNLLDSRLQIIREQIHINPEITFTYFIADSKKEGGEYVTVSGFIKRINEYNQIIILQDNTEIPIADIIRIEGEIFKNKELE